MLDRRFRTDTVAEIEDMRSAGGLFLDLRHGDVERVSSGDECERIEVALQDSAGWESLGRERELYGSASGALSGGFPGQRGPNK